jgi:hypothetical protein
MGREVDCNHLILEYLFDGCLFPTFAYESITEKFLKT